MNKVMISIVLLVLLIVMIGCTPKRIQSPAQPAPVGQTPDEGSAITDINSGISDDVTPDEVDNVTSDLDTLDW